ncbi:hypothetical protein GE09DRAFT_1220512 [Coniochaeta sp. 2T2.1]|nr:hypothetical protein GE09DRAFT_1220512 [Coniochaeta sp. 2T2.1]
MPETPRKPGTTNTPGTPYTPGAPCTPETRNTQQAAETPDTSEIPATSNTLETPKKGKKSEEPQKGASKGEYHPDYELPDKCASWKHMDLNDRATESCVLGGHLFTCPTDKRYINHPGPCPDCKRRRGGN